MLLDITLRSASRSSPMACLMHLTRYKRRLGCIGQSENSPPRIRSSSAAAASMVLSPAAGRASRIANARSRNRSRAIVTRTALGFLTSDLRSFSSSRAVLLRSFMSLCATSSRSDRTRASPSTAAPDAEISCSCIDTKFTENKFPSDFFFLMLNCRHLMIWSRAVF